MNASRTSDNSAYATLADLDRDLLARVDPLMAWLGVTGRRRGNRWIGGNPGARIEIVLFGSNAGAWGAWSRGKKGRGLIGVIALERGIPYREAIRDARAFLGEPDPADRRRPAYPPPQTNAERRVSRIAYACKLWAEARPVADTIAEVYLTKVRGFTAPADGWPDDIRFHPPSRSLILAGRDDRRAVQFVHRVFLTNKADNVRDRYGQKKKLTKGPMDGAAFRLPGDIFGPIVHAEGAETAIAAWLATGHETHCRFGALGDAARPGHDRSNIILVDDDPAGHPTETALERALPRWQAEGLDVALVYPWPQRRHDKSDFADVLATAGAEAIRRQVENAPLLHARAREEAERKGPEQTLSDPEPPYIDPALARCTPPFALPTATPTEVHEAVLHRIHSFFAQRDITPPVHIVVPGQTGSGKTQKAGQLLPHVIAADKAERLLPGGSEDHPYRWVVMVPAHRLGRQIAERYEALGLSVAILEGRGDPWKAKPTRPYLCQNLEAVGMALQAHQDVRSAVCGTASSEHRCPFFDGCAYRAQFADARTADVLIVANAFVFEPLPEAVLKGVRGVIIDEDFVPAADAVGELSVDTFRKAAIERWPALLRNGQIDTQSTAHTIELSARVAAMFDDAPDGYLPDDAAAKAGPPKKDFDYLRHLHWKRRRRAKMHPGQSLAERREALKAAEINQQLPRIAAALRMLAAGQFGRLRLYSDGGRDGARRGIVLHGQRKVAAWLRDLPVLMLNASARIEDIERFFPDAVMAKLPQARLEHQRVHQILGSFGKSAMSKHKLNALADDLRIHLARGKTVLVLCHEQDEAFFLKEFPKAVASRQLRVLHHGNYAGDDDHGDVDVIMHVGGSFARAGKIAEMATARYGVPVPIAEPVRTTCAALMEDGTGVTFERLAYQHPLAQQVHESIYDQVFVQGGLGRGRGINRSAATPLEIFVYGNVPLPVPIASIRRFEPVREKLLLATVGTHSNAADLCLFTNEFRTLDAAVKWRQRNSYDEAKLRRLLADDPRPFDKITWQPAGQGRKRRCSILPAGEVQAFRQRVLRQFGKLLLWTVERFTPGKPSELVDIVGDIDLPNVSTTSRDDLPGEAGLRAESRYRVERPPDG